MGGGQRRGEPPALGLGLQPRGARGRRDPRQRDDGLAPRHARRRRERGRASENDAKLAQKLGQLQPSIAVFPPENMGQLAYFGPT